MKQNRYPNGYLPKIAYHIAQNNEAKVDYFLNQQTRRYGELTSEDKKFILNALTDMGAEDAAPDWLDITPKTSCYNFNFIGGGWNQIWATSKDEAIRLAIEKYAYSENCNPDPQTFRLETKEDTDALMSLFY